MTKRQDIQKDSTHRKVRVLRGFLYSKAHRSQDKISNLSRAEVLRLMESSGKSNIDLSKRELPGIDFSSDVIRTEMERKAFPYDHPPIWYNSSTSGVNFQGANFTGANLQKALLWRGNFTKAIFHKANLQKADLGCSVLVEADLTRANLDGAVLERADLRGANLSCAKLINADLRDVDLSEVNSLNGIFLSGANLNNTSIRREQLQGGLGEEREGNFYGANDAYRVLKNNFMSLGKYDDVSWAYVKERQMERRANNPFKVRRFYCNLELSEPTSLFTKESLFFTFRHLSKWVWDWISELLCGYGEKPLRVVFGAIATIVAFSLLYYASGGIANSHGMPPLTWLDYVQYSLATFGTINLPDIIAINHSARLLTSIEAMIGISLLALLMFTLGNKIGKS